MDAVNIYGTAAGGILILFILARLRPAFCDLVRIFSILVSKYLVYLYVLNRHRWFGPWTWAGIIKNLVYGALNCVVILYRVHTWEDATVRAGRLALVNMAVLFMTPQLSVMADILGISLQTCWWIHRAAGWMTFALAITHTLSIQKSVNPQQAEILFAIIVCCSKYYLVQGANQSLGHCLTSNDHDTYLSNHPQADLRTILENSSRPHSSMPVRHLASFAASTYLSTTVSLHSFVFSRIEHSLPGRKISIPEQLPLIPAEAACNNYL